MSTWSQLESEAPELAGEVRRRFDAHAHKTLATIRADGAPRISGTESKFADGELWIGSMWRARKALDLQRDPRFALHSGSDDPPDWRGDAKVAGIAEEITDPALIDAVVAGEAPPGPLHLYRLDLREASVVRLDETGTALVIESWTPGRGVRTVTRA